MKRILQVASVLALSIAWPLGSQASGGGDDAVLQPCATSSADTFCDFASASIETSGGAHTALLLAIQAVQQQLVDLSGVSCGPCEIADACQPYAVLEESIKHKGPTEIRPWLWTCEAWYAGCYFIECGECDA